jgi:hypothetical protein
MWHHLCVAVTADLELRSERLDLAVPFRQTPALSARYARRFVGVGW